MKSLHIYNSTFSHLNSQAVLSILGLVDAFIFIFNFYQEICSDLYIQYAKRL